MNQQDIVNQNIRMIIGDLQVNLMVAQARIAELEQQLAAAVGHDVFKQADEPIPEVSRPNGKEARQ